MYNWVINKIKRDNTLTEEEKTQRCADVAYFWSQEGKRCMRLVKKIGKEDDISFDNFFLYMSYWIRFKLICEGKEPTIENVLASGMDIHALKIFLSDITDLIHH